MDVLNVCERLAALLFVDGVGFGFVCELVRLTGVKESNQRSLALLLLLSFLLRLLFSSSLESDDQ